MQKKLRLLASKKPHWVMSFTAKKRNSETFFHQNDQSQKSRKNPWRVWILARECNLFQSFDWIYQWSYCHYRRKRGVWKNRRLRRCVRILWTRLASLWSTTKPQQSPELAKDQRSSMILCNTLLFCTTLDRKWSLDQRSSPPKTTGTNRQSLTQVR